jgi:hypothetical protein
MSSYLGFTRDGDFEESVVRRGGIMPSEVCRTAPPESRGSAGKISPVEPMTSSIVLLFGCTHTWIYFRV